MLLVQLLYNASFTKNKKINKTKSVRNFTRFLITHAHVNKQHAAIIQIIVVTFDYIILHLKQTAWWDQKKHISRLVFCDMLDVLSSLSLRNGQT